MTTDEFDRLLSRFEDASIALHVEQTRSAQDRWEVAGDAIRAELDRLSKGRTALLRLLGRFAELTACTFDNGGGCQAHGVLSLGPGEQCPHAEAKALLAAEGVAR